MHKLIFFTIVFSFLITKSPIYLVSEKSVYEEIPYLNRLIYIESRNNPRAKSPKGAIGLMQIMECALEDHRTFAGGTYTMNDMYDPKNNLEVGIWYLQRIRSYYDSNEIKSISAYNCGFGNTDNGIYNIKYLLDILGRDKVYKWLEGKKTKSWKGKKSCYIVTDR